MKGPRQELTDTGTLGPEGAALLYRTVAAVAVARNFPPPPGSGVWDASAVEGVAHDLIVGDRGRKRLTDALLRSTDERSFAKVIEGATVNFLRDVSRRSDVGKVILRVTEILRAEEQFVEVAGRPPRWRLFNAPGEPSSAGAGDLAHAARLENNVVVPVWTSDRRDAPIADRASLVRILVRILAVANGSITAADAAQAVSARIDVRRAPLTIELDTLERVAEPAADDPAAEVASRSTAKAIFDRLDDRERILLAAFHLPLDQAAAQLTLRRSQTSVLRQRLVERLRRELGFDLESGIADDEDGAEAEVRALRDLCLRWSEDRTLGEGATSPCIEEGGK